MSGHLTWIIPAAVVLWASGAALKGRLPKPRNYEDIANDYVFGDEDGPQPREEGTLS